MVVAAVITDCSFVVGEGGRGWGGSRRYDEVFDERKLVEMICMQPPLDVHKIMKNHLCCCLCCGRLGRGEEGRPHLSLPVVGMDGNDNQNGNCLSKKGAG